MILHFNLQFRWFLINVFLIMILLHLYVDIGKLLHPSMLQKCFFVSREIRQRESKCYSSYFKIPFYQDLTHHILEINFESLSSTILVKGFIALISHRRAIVTQELFSFILAIKNLFNGLHRIIIYRSLSDVT